MKPETRRPHLESGTSTEVRESGEDKPELKEQSTPEMIRARLRELEQVVVTDIRKRFAGLTLSRDPSFLERLATVAILTQAFELQSQLLANEPLADDGPVVADIVDSAPIDPSLIPPDEDAQARLQAFVEVHVIDGDKFGASISGEKYIKPDDFDKPIIISDLGEMSLNRYITDAERTQLVDNTWQQSSFDWRGASGALHSDDEYIKIFVDKNGNTISCKLFQMDSTDYPNAWIEHIDVQTPLRFSDGDTVRKIPIKIDFSEVDPTLGEIDTGIYQQELLPLGSSTGIPVYVDNSESRLSDGANRQVMMDQFTAQETYIDSGVRFIYALYNRSPDMTGYVLSDDHSGPGIAYANFRDGTIILTQKLLRPEEIGWTSADVELVASHEAAHHTTYEYGITGHPAVESVFAKYGDRLKRLNEGALVGDSTGHAEDDTYELCASTMASLAHDRWEESTQALSSEDRAMYLDVLKAIEQAHADAISFKEPIPGIPKGLDIQTKLTGKEPIFRLLRDRITRLDQMQ